MPSFTNNNTRVFYPTYAVAMGAMGASAVADSWGFGDSLLSGAVASGSVLILHGLQTFNVTTNFSLEAISEIGQLSSYEQVEGIPDVQCSMEKYLDGYTTLYHASTPTATSPTLIGRSESRADVRAVVGLSTADAIVSGRAAVAELYNSGMYISSLSYNLATGDIFRESVSLVGNTKKWITETGDGQSLLLGSGNGNINSAFSVFGSDRPNSPDSGVMRQENVVINSGGQVINGTTFRTVIPSIIQGVVSGAQAVSSTTASVNCGVLNPNLVHIQSISVSVDLTREQIEQLGSKVPYSRYVNFPVDVTTDIEVIAVGGDNINAVESANNLSNHTVQVVLQDSTVLQLGNKNKIQSVTWGGGDAGGGNVNVTINMTNQNDLAVLHSGDPALSTIGAANYWKDHFA